MREWPASPTPKFRRAVFIDRDGTLNVDSHYPYKLDELELIPRALEGLEILTDLPLEIVVATNQAGIALGLFSLEEMSRFNAAMRALMRKKGVRVDAFYFCPDLEPKNLPAEMEASPCSKPAPGMLLEAAQEFRLDLPQSFVIGDRSSDIAAGKAAGCLTILVKTGKAGKEEGALDIIPDFEASDLYEAALIIRQHIERSA
ncbi:MAG: D-glycero-alpha-D-manno-heptose-1,7-bisphosphate 7-phosphatase [Thermoleophilia bacterium]